MEERAVPVVALPVVLWGGTGGSWRCLLCLCFGGVTQLALLQLQLVWVLTRGVQAHMPSRTALGS